jgi:hypothetical protein
LFSSIKFDDKAIEIFEKISESVFQARQHDYLEQNRLVEKNIDELEFKKRNILEHI